MSKTKTIAFAFLVLFSQSCSDQIPEEVAAAAAQLPDQLDFNLHIKPILSDRCFACHGPDEAKRKAGLRLDQAESAHGPLPENPGKRAIRPGKPQASELVHRILAEDPEQLMPPPESELQLSAREKATLIRWIAEGGDYQPHWAWLAPKGTEPPTVRQEERVNNPIDRFILRKIEQQGWAPAPEADRETLLRRLSLDLTGLPPTLPEMDAFLADDSPSAYEQAVDRLLDSPHYGERMATDWMDVARFADTHGYTVDRYRDMSPWRDWVIKAFNENMPYDQFVTWQLAGDLLPDATKEQILATGFNRNHQQNMEGGIVEEEFRIEYVADRTNTLGKAFLGLTMECARCHDHKYDPISQRSYYELFSFFNNVREAGQISWNDATPVPTLVLSDEKIDSIRQFLNKQITSSQNALADLRDAATPAFTRWLQNDRPALARHKTIPKGMTAYFPLDNKALKNQLPPYQQGAMKTQLVNTSAELTAGFLGTGVLLDGDAWLDLSPSGVFDRAAPFSISLWLKLPGALKNGMIFHKGIGAVLYNWRGFHLALKDNRLEVLMAHTAPYNAIIKYGDDLPRDTFIHLALTYDGSGRGDGLNVYVNGSEFPTTVDIDNLYKTILFQFEGQEEVGLQIGARWRGVGIKGAIVDEIRIFDRQLTELELLQLTDPATFRELATKPSEQLTPSETAKWEGFYLAAVHPKINQQRQQLQNLRRQAFATVDSLPEIMVIREMETPRPTYVLERGQYNVPGDRVYPNTPASILPMPEALPRNRLGLAQWLFLPDHPLTARVAVNRIWQQFFGQGLVRTPEDFGNQGALPSHPELLDWLATDFRANGWDIKRLVKMIVMSATYRQSSKVPPELSGQDPTNRWLARGPSQRLSAEMLRDNILAASGLLVRRLGGPSVKPYQPEGLWRINGGTYRAGTGEELYRRSLYTFWKRTVPHPTQATFDAPNRDNCTVRRQKTSTPLQALVLLNDPVYIEGAAVLAEKMRAVEHSGRAVEMAFRLLTGRRPSPEERDLLVELHDKTYENFSASPDKTAGWLQAGAHAPLSGEDPALLAAYAVVASTIVNADATIVKR